MKPFNFPIEVRFGDRKEIFVRIRTRVWDSVQQAYVPGPYRNLTGCSFLSQIRLTTEDTTIIAQFTATMGDQSEPTLGLGSVNLKLTGQQTAAINRALEKAVWDFQITDPDGNVDTYMAGKVTLTKDVSRA